MTLPADPIAHPDLDLEPELIPARRLTRPAALAAVIVLGTVILTACLLGAAFSGLFGTGAKDGTGTAAGPPRITVGPLPAQQATHFDDGLWLVGRDIVAGTYQTSVPAESAGCLWERADSPDGTLSSVLESGAGNPGGQVVVTIKTTDAVFRSHACGQWQQVAGPEAT